MAPFNEVGFGETRQSATAERHRLGAIKQSQPAIFGVAKSHQRSKEPVQQLLQVFGLQFGVKQSVESLSFCLSNLVIGIVQRQDDAELQLLAGPAEVLVFVGMRQNQDGIEHAVVLPQPTNDARRRDIQLGQAPSAILHHLEEICRRLVRGQHSSCRARCDGAQRFDLFRIVPELAQTLAKAGVQLSQMRFEHSSQALELESELIAEHVGSISQHGRIFGCAHELNNMVGLEW